MKKFYKLNPLEVGSGTIIPDGYIEYTEEPIELLDALEAERIAIENIVPRTISPRQARLILLKYELLDDIESLIATNRALGIWWEYSLDISRSNEYLLSACYSMGITDEQLGNMFKEASKL